MSTARRHIALQDGWTLKAVGGSGIAELPAELANRSVPARTPGCVHTDLLAADAIADPYLDDNEQRLAWIGRIDWRYETVVDWVPDGDGPVDLVCEGLDTVARIECNGTEIAQTRNMHRGYRFDVSALLRPGENHFSVTFTSAMDHIETVRAELGARPHVNRFPFNMIRKMACNFGWDWGPELVTAGIWRPIALEQWHTARLDSVRPLVTVDGGTGRVDVHVDVQRSGGEPVVARAWIGTHETTVLLDGDSAVLSLAVPDAELWWPRGYGGQPLYPLDVALSTVDGEELDQWSGRVGFRTITLDTGSDEHGSRFTFVVNGVPIFVKGVNWIPDDCFPHRVDRARYEQRFTQAVDAGVNLLRVWGGGIYESEDFYELADELGLLVWQDFLFACAAYPEEEPLRGEVVAEARAAVTRLSGHAALALWSGCNENIWGYYDWGWQEELGDLTWGAGYYTRILPEIVDELDGTRPYIAGSPWSYTFDIHPNDQHHGCTHIWDVWNQRDYTGYLDYIPRFASEFGFCGAATLPTLRRALHDEPLTPESPGIIGHNKAADGSAKLAARLAEHFPPPRNFTDWHWGTQLNQARAISLGIQHFRSHAPRCAGTILWQLNDCWPVSSWAVVDGDARLKPAWYALRDSFADRLLTFQERQGKIALIVVNDTAQRWTDRVLVRRVAFDGTELGRRELPVIADPRATVTIELPADLTTPTDPTVELLVADVSGPARASRFFASDLEQRLPEARYTVSVAPVDEGHAVTVTAETLLRDLTLLADQADDAVVDQALLTVLPGETTTFTVRTSTRLEPDALISGLRTAQQLTTPNLPLP